MQEHVFSMPEGGDRSQGWAILSVCWVFVLIALITTILRFFVRTRLTHNLGSDDWVMLAAMILTVIGASFITTEVTAGGLGRHMYYLEDHQKRVFTAVGWADWIQTFINLCLMKVSICLFLLRIVDGKKYRYALWGLISFLVLYTSIFVFLFLGVCRPLAAYWRIERPGDVCMSDSQIENITLAQGILSAMTDVVIAAFPIFFLKNLRVSLRTKMALCVLMGLGLITAACAIVRSALSGALTNPDLTWAISPNIAWRLPEVNIGIACANAPTLRPLYLFFCGRLDTNRSSKKYSAAGSGMSGSRNPFNRPPPNSKWTHQDSVTVHGSHHGGRSDKDKRGGAGSANGMHAKNLDLELGPEVPSKEGFGNRADAWAS